MLVLVKMKSQWTMAFLYYLLIVVKMMSRLFFLKVAVSELEKLKSQISDVTKRLPLDKLENFLQPLTEVQQNVSDATQYTQLSSKIRYYTGLYL